MDMTVFNQSLTVDARTGETFQPISCMACGKIAEIYNGSTDPGWAEVRRGNLAPQNADGNLSDAEIGERENIKFSRAICPECFMTDRDLCAFFNRCGCRIR